MPEMKKSKRIFWLAIIIVFAIVISAIIINYYSSPADEPIGLDLVEKIKQQKQYDLPEGNNYWLGAKDPKITLVEFADFSCSACKNTYPKLREIIFNYASDVKVIYRDFPVISEDSLGLALAGRCAGEQGLFWLMHDGLFEEQGKITNSKLADIAGQIGVDIDKFNDCLKNKKYLDDIKKDFAQGEKLDIKGTPTLFINGYKITGDIPKEALMKIIEGFLNN